MTGSGITLLKIKQYDNIIVKSNGFKLVSRIHVTDEVGSPALS